MKRSHGFTLIEAMVTVAIVAILASITYPSYTEYVRRGRRAEARSVLLESAQWMERFYTQHQRYDANIAGTATTDPSLFYANFKYSPRSVSTPGSYQLTLVISNTLPNNYTVTAAPIGNMAADRCGSYVVNHLGGRGNVGYTGFADDADAAQKCWK